MKRIIPLAIALFSSIAMAQENIGASDQQSSSPLKHYIFKTKNNEDNTPSIEQCRESNYYAQTGIDASIRHGVTFLHTKLKRSELKVRRHRGELTTGYGCLWYDFSGPEVKVHTKSVVNTPLGPLVAEGPCIPIGYESRSGQTFAKSNCLQAIAENATTDLYGIESGSMVSSTVFRIDGPQVEGVSGSTWIIDTWGEDQHPLGWFMHHRTK